MCTISIAYISAISKPIHVWFPQNYLLFKGYKVSYNGPSSKFFTSTLKTAEGALPPFSGGGWVPM